MNAYFDAVQTALENYGLLLPDPAAADLYFILQQLRFDYFCVYV